MKTKLSRFQVSVDASFRSTGQRRGIHKYLRLNTWMTKCGNTASDKIQTYPEKTKNSHTTKGKHL